MLDKMRSRVAIFERGIKDQRDGLATGEEELWTFFDQSLLTTYICVGPIHASTRTFVA